MANARARGSEPSGSVRPPVPSSSCLCRTFHDPVQVDADDPPCSYRVLIAPREQPNQDRPTSPEDPKYQLQGIGGLGRAHARVSEGRRELMYLGDLAAVASRIGGTGCSIIPLTIPAGMFLRGRCSTNARGVGCACGSSSAPRISRDPLRDGCGSAVSERAAAFQIKLYKAEIGAICRARSLLRYSKGSSTITRDSRT